MESLLYLGGGEMPTRSASALHIFKMCQALSKRFERVDCLYVQNSQESLEEFYGEPPLFGSIVFGVPTMPGGGFRIAIKAVLKELVEGRHDAYYGRHPHALLALSIFNKPFAYEAHTLPESKFRRGLLSLLLRRSNCRGLVCISEVLRQDYQQQMNFSGPAYVLHDAADPVKDDSNLEGGSRGEAAWIGREEVAQVGYVGHLYQGKGMEIIAALCQKMPDVDFHVIGGREEELDLWKRKVSAPNLFMHGFVPHHKLAAMYKKLDIALLPAQKEVWIAENKTEIGRWTSPLKAFEYMSHGLPIVSSRLKVLEEIFTHEHDALLVDPADPDQWVGAIRKLQSNSTLADHIGANAKSGFIAKHTWDARAAEVKEIIC